MSDTQITRAQMQDMHPLIAQDGELLRSAVADLTRQAGALPSGWTRFVRVMVMDVPPLSDDDY